MSKHSLNIASLFHGAFVVWIDFAIRLHYLVSYLQNFGAGLQRLDDELAAKCVKYPVGVWTPSHRVHRRSCSGTDSYTEWFKQAHVVHTVYD